MLDSMPTGTKYIERQTLCGFSGPPCIVVFYCFFALYALFLIELQVSCLCNSNVKLGCWCLKVGKPGMTPSIKSESVYKSMRCNG